MVDEHREQRLNPRVPTDAILSAAIGRNMNPACVFILPTRSIRASAFHLIGALARV
jgi:hypothetical protein